MNSLVCRLMTRKGKNTVITPIAFRYLLRGEWLRRGHATDPAYGWSLVNER